jgi:hypothetical protein
MLQRSCSRTQSIRGSAIQSSQDINPNHEQNTRRSAGLHFVSTFVSADEFVDDFAGLQKEGRQAERGEG